MHKIDNINTTVVGDSSKKIPFPDESAHICVTSPPYNVGKDYDFYKDKQSFDNYLNILESVWKEVYRTLVPGGRICVNVANTGRKPYVPLSSFISIGLLNVGFLLMGEIVWDKGPSVGTSTAWGSWNSASSPSLRDVHEYIIVACKESYKRTDHKDKISSISSSEFVKLTKSIWTISTEKSTGRINHPCPFPIELVHNLLILFSFKDDVVLDPFMGSGQTGIAAIMSGRNFFGVDIDENYVKLSNKRTSITVLDFVDDMY